MTPAEFARGMRELSGAAQRCSNDAEMRIVAGMTADLAAEAQTQAPAEALYEAQERLQTVLIRRAAR